MVATRVQSASNAGSAASLTVASGQGWAAPTSGNLLVAWANSDATVTVNNSMTLQSSVVDGNGVYLWSKVATGSETSWTFTPSVSDKITAGVVEYSGTTASPFDAAATPTTIHFSTGTTTTATTATGTSTDGDLFIGVAGLHVLTGSLPSGPSWTNSFTNFVNVNTGALSSPDCATFIGDYQNTTAAAVSTSCSWTGSADDRQELLVAFKLAPAGPNPGVPTFVAASNGQSTAISGAVATSWPTGVATGNRVFLQFSSIATFTTPSGWTELRDRKSVV